MPSMADPRIIDISLDERTILWRNADVEQERRIAIFDLLEENHFAPRIAVDPPCDGPWRLTLRLEEDRLIIDLASEGRDMVGAIMLALAPFRRVIRDYFAMCDSYYRAIRNATPGQIETIDMARRALHNDAAERLKARLESKADIDFATARRLFTLICVLHIRG